MGKVIKAACFAILALVVIGVGGCDTISPDRGGDYPPTDGTLRAGSPIPQLGTDSMD